VWCLLVILFSVRRIASLWSLTLYSRYKCRYTRKISALQLRWLCKIPLQQNFKTWKTRYFVISHARWVTSWNIITSRGHSDHLDLRKLFFFFTELFSWSRN
jgi:hypothetical protein